VFPGTSSEGAAARAFERAGAEPDVFVIRSLTPVALEESAQEMEKRIRKSQIVVFVGGLVGGDEPDGAGKFINAFLRRDQITEAVRDLIHNRDGLMLGISGGFSALLKLGLLPYGDIRDVGEDCPALVKNPIGRHHAGMARIRVASNLSPWLSKLNAGDVYTLPVSTAYGRFIAPDSLHDKQIATQYTGCNPFGSDRAIEGITSPDGRIFGTMAHCERFGESLYRNVPGNTHMDIFSGAVDYWR
jgi:phosphoribosylformylglycinamidine synthase